MEIQQLIGWISEYGYAALFFCLWLGIVGIPIPDELVVMTGGLVCATGLLKPFPAFLVTYFGVVSGLSIGYVIGRIIGVKVIDYLRKKHRFVGYLDKSQSLIDKYGAFTLCFSYFIPVVRHLVPYLVGSNKMSFRQYSLFSYTIGFVWTLALFSVGRYFGESMQNLGREIRLLGIVLLFLALCTWVVMLQVKRLKSKKVLEEDTILAADMEQPRI